MRVDHEIGRWPAVAYSGVVGRKISQNVTGVGEPGHRRHVAVVDAEPRSASCRYSPNGSSPVRVITAAERP